MAATEVSSLLMTKNISHNKEIIMKDTLVSGSPMENSLSLTHTHTHTHTHTDTDTDTHTHTHTDTH